MEISSADTLSLIPQRPPFVMIDKLVSCDPTKYKTTFLVTAGNLLVDNGNLSEAGLTENIAQTAAAGAGYLAKQISEPILNGYIGSIKNLEVFGLPKVGAVVETEVNVENQIFDVTIISGTVKCAEVLLARCEMKIFISN